MKHTLKIAAMGLVIVLAGCSTLSLPGPLGKIPLTANPLASALRQCAMLSELLTPGINLSAIFELARSVAADNALGNTAQGAMRNCASLLDTIAD